MDFLLLGLESYGQDRDHFHFLNEGWMGGWVVVRHGEDVYEFWEGVDLSVGVYVFFSLGKGELRRNSKLQSKILKVCSQHCCSDNQDFVVD